MNEQEIRAKALEAASRIVNPGATPRKVIDLATELAKWIETGEMPERQPGTFGY